MTKVLHVINNLDKGGAEKLLVDFLPCLKAAGIDVTLLQLSDVRSEKVYIQELLKGGCEVVSLGSRSLYDPSNTIKMFRYLKRSKPDIVHVHLFPTMYWVAAAAKFLPSRLRPKVIFTEHSSQNNRINNFFIRPIDRMIYSVYNKVIAISPTIKSKLDQWTGTPQKTVVIRNGLNVDRFSSAKSLAQISVTSSSPQNEHICKILMAARFLFPKKQGLLVQALAELPENFHLFFAGEGQGMQQCKQLASELGIQPRVHFLGFRTDLPQLMKTMDINILATGYEGMSGVTVESLAVGKPFLGSDVPGVNDIVPDNRFLFQNNKFDISKKIFAIYNSPSLSEEMGADGARFATQFSMTSMVNNHLNLYTDLMNSIQK